MIRACFCAVFLASAASAQGISSAQLIEPTERYAHHPMGATVADHGALELVLTDGARRVIRLPQSRVFEDNAARLADVTGDGAPEVVVVESDQARGARVAVYGAEGLIAASAFIGQRNRWYAVSAITDLDGDGRVEVVAIDRPHLRRTLVVWRIDGAALVPVAEYAGVTNHRFGEAVIQGGVRDCAPGAVGGGPEVIVARADWSGIVALTFRNGVLTARDLGDGADDARFAWLMDCSGD